MSTKDQQNLQAPNDSWELLSELFTENRKARMESVSKNRTDYLRLAIQDIHDPHNVSACLRSAEAMGIKDVDVVTLKNSFKATGPSRGTRYWSDIHSWQSVSDCVQHLKSKGYLLCAGLPSQDALPLTEIPLDKPLCVIFGNEHEGISDEWLDHIDIPFTIPMVGMVESLNISVAAAITMHDLTRRLKESIPSEKYLISENSRQDLLNRWAYAQTKNASSQIEILRKRKE